MGDLKHGETYRHVRRLLFGADAFCCALAVLAAIALTVLILNGTDERRMRVDFNELVNKAEAGTLAGNTLAENALPDKKGAGYALFNAGGEVLTSTLPAYRVGEAADLHILSGLGGIRSDGKLVTFVSPVMRDGSLAGLLLVTAPKSAYRAPAAGWLALLAAAPALAGGTMLLLYLTRRRVRKDLLAPLGMLHEATRNMLRVDLSTRLQYDDSNEAGTLCHDFEAMRDELAASFKRESDLLNNDRLLYAGVSHDLKTPLAAISGYAEEIRDGLADSPERVNELTTLMLKKVRLLTKLIDDILEETKAQLGELSIVPEELYAPDFFVEVCGELSLDAARAGISFELGDIPQVLIAIDRKRMIQVLQNLVGNSIKYTPRGGLISVRFSVRDHALIVGVKDNGCGIAAGDIPYVFDRFYRGDAARTQNIPGSGLGLSIAKSIVERHGGRIECDSVLGVGTEVCFSLPL